MQNIRSAAVLASLMLFLPAAVLLLPAYTGRNENRCSDIFNADTPFYRVLITAEDTVREISVRDYLIGAVAAEMPAEYERAALCAQTIACHTYAERMRLIHQTEPDGSIDGADFSDDSSRYQAFYTDAQLHAFWGDSYEANYKKIAEAVDAVGNLVLYYEGAPIVAAFHAVSAGETESAKTVWCTDLPYLVSVPSAEDTDCPTFESSCVFSAKTLSAALQAAHPALKLPDDAAEWLGAPDCSDAGTVLRIRIGNDTFTGAELREILALRSACFTVSFDAESRLFSFTVHGRGHMVGMSQYGAHQMARAGADFREILLHYYPGTELVIL